MSKKLSESDKVAIKTVLKRFIDIAPGFEIILDEPGEDSYIHILRDGKIVGCFGKDKDSDIVFQFHNSYKGRPGCSSGEKTIKQNDLTDDDIKEAILRTTGKAPSGKRK